MTIHRLSASGLGRARKCLYWAREGVTWPERESPREARLGTAVHAGIEHEITTGDAIDALDLTERHGLDELQSDSLDAMLERWREWWPRASSGASWKAERAYAWSVRTNEVRELPRLAHRDYGTLDPYEIPGTVDVVGFAGESVHVRDWKTGRQTVEDPATNMQLAHNGACAAIYAGLDEASVGYVKISEQSVFASQIETLDAMSFGATRDELAGMVDRTPTSEPNPGPWCDWCPAKGACPETALRVEQVIEASSLVRRVPMSLEIKDNEHAAGMLTAVDAVETFIGELKKRLKAYADANGGIMLPDGSIYARTDIPSERPDLGTEGAADALRKLGLSAAIEESTTWTAIKKAGGKDGEAKAREVLRAMGATKKSVTPRYEAKAKKGRAA